MEGYMSTKVTYEIKLPLSLTVILGLIAFGLVGNLAVKTVEPAWASTRVMCTVLKVRRYMLSKLNNLICVTLNYI